MSQIQAYRELATARYQSLPSRDRMALLILSVFLAILVVVYGLISPAMEFRDNAKSAYQQERDLLGWLQAQEAAVKALKQRPQTTKSSGSPLTLVNSSAKRFKLTIKRLQPENNGDLRVWMEGVSFDDALKWLHHLNTQGLKIVDISIDQQSPGRVNLRSTFR
jgi:general secretion pathway protein M